MAKDKILTPNTIQNEPFPGEMKDVDFDSTQKTSNEEANPAKTKDQGFPTKPVAVELLSVSINTKSKKVMGEFELVDAGGFRIGKFQAGLTGELVITPNGITAKNKDGITTFAIDATTGSAVFAGTIQAGSLIAGEVIVGNNTWIIDGDSDFPRIVLYNDGIPEIILGEVGT